MSRQRRRAIERQLVEIAGTDESGLTPHQLLGQIRELQAMRVHVELLILTELARQRHSMQNGQDRR